jgi:competence protein ComEC
MMVPLGFTAGLLSVVALPLASLLNDLTGLLANALIALADFGSSLPHLIWGEVSGLGYTLFYLAVLALALVAQGKLKLWQGLLVVTAAISASMLTMPRQQAEVIFLDVGQGDSALIRLPGRQEILMDGGGSPFGSFDVGKRIVVPALKALGIDELELVIASHNDTDHVEGLISVLEEMKVNQLVIGARKDGDALFDKLMAAATRNNVPVMQVTRTQTLSLVEARLNILNPPHKLFEKDNDNSVAFALYYKDEAKALFLGDLSVDVEAGIAFPKVDILMAGHHGSPSSTSEKLLRAAQPEHVVFSYGRNNYGHPHGEVMQRVLAIGATVHETFHSGAVRLRLD